LGYIHKNGISHYGLVDLGFGVSEDEQYFNVGIGYQIGLKLKQVMEFQPFVRYVADIDMDVTKETVKENKKYYTAHYVDPGMRIVINCGYPFQLFVQGSYAVPVYKGLFYETAPGHGDSWSSQYNIGAGFKINF
jgi:hypothetical protein